jgi:hypothetical protein
MAKKPKDAPEQKAPAAGPAPSPEEIRRRHVEASAKDRLKFLGNDLEDLISGDLKKSDRLGALETVGEKIMEIALQTRGRLRAAGGHSDAYLSATDANVLTGLRHATKTMEMHDREMQSWPDSLELVKPVMKDLQRIAEGMDRPGVKTAIGPSGEALFDDELQPAPKAAEAAAPEPPATSAPEPAPVPAPEPAPAPAAYVQEREIPTLATKACPVIDVVPEPEPNHPLDGKTDGEAEEMIQAMFENLEEAGVEEGLKRKDWSKAWNLWIVAWPEDCGMTIHRQVFDMLTFALEGRKPISWDVPTMPDVFAWQRKLAIAAGE